MSSGESTDLAAAPISRAAGNDSGVSEGAAAPKVTVRNLHFYYGSSHALKGINLDLADRSITAFIAPRAVANPRCCAC